MGSRSSRSTARSERTGPSVFPSPPPPGSIRDAGGAAPRERRRREPSRGGLAHAAKTAGPPGPPFRRRRPYSVPSAERPRTARGRCFLRPFTRPLTLVLLVFGQMWAASAGAAPSVLGMRMFDGSTHTRVVFDLSAPVDYNLFSLRRPDRVVLDFKGVAFKAEIKNGFRRNRRIAGIRQAKRNDDRYRVVFDLVRQERARSFLLSPHGRRGHRLVVDFGRTLEARAKTGRTSPVPGASKPAPTGRLRDVVVAIDAGHGGKDPGAIGRRKKTREKHVTLAIARKLAAELRRRPGIRPVLVRDGDYFIPLRRRTAIAARPGRTSSSPSMRTPSRTRRCAVRPPTCSPGAGRAARRRGGSRRERMRRIGQGGSTSGDTSRWSARRWWTCPARVRTG